MENRIKKPPKVIQTPVCLPPGMVEELDAQAEAEGLMRGRSAIVRRACAEYLDRHGRQQSGNARETAQEGDL